MACLKQERWNFREVRSSADNGAEIGKATLRKCCKNNNKNCDKTREANKNDQEHSENDDNENSVRMLLQSIIAHYLQCKFHCMIQY